eukprot:NODE_534_length_2133_cov_34.533109_g492_i0.p1 GENE.NODE_534_length_2133_cov_34.533109_g492_i0~~NODE_534_length_2133_cov_34.533109_g492_i0.p1  ORF type:complete len:664 (+),score=87.27 NODE_534_length_2133_cov_34.533109_g492_i0:113-2104(+)
MVFPDQLSASSTLNWEHIGGNVTFALERHRLVDSSSSAARKLASGVRGFIGRDHHSLPYRIRLRVPPKYVVAYSQTEEELHADWTLLRQAILLRGGVDGIDWPTFIPGLNGKHEAVRLESESEPEPCPSVPVRSTESAPVIMQKRMSTDSLPEFSSPPRPKTFMKPANLTAPPAWSPRTSGSVPATPLNQPFLGQLGSYVCSAQDSLIAVHDVLQMHPAGPLVAAGALLVIYLLGWLVQLTSIAMVSLVVLSLYQPATNETRNASAAAGSLNLVKELSELLQGMPLPAIVSGCVLAVPLLTSLGGLLLLPVLGCAGYWLLEAVPRWMDPSVAPTVLTFADYTSPEPFLTTVAPPTPTLGPVKSGPPTSPKNLPRRTSGGGHLLTGQRPGSPAVSIPSGYLGNLTDEQRQALDSLRLELRRYIPHFAECFNIASTEPDCNRQCLRWLRSHKFDAQDAFKAIQRCVKWRDEFAGVGVNQLKSAKTRFLKELQRGKMSYTGRGHSGVPVLWLRAHLHHKGDSPLELIEMSSVYFIEHEILPLLRKDEDQREGPESETLCLVADCSRFQSANADVDSTRSIVELFRDFYPETLNVALIVDAPWRFTAMWKLLKGRLHPVTLQKTHFVTRAELEQWVPQNSWDQSYRDDPIATRSTPTMLGSPRVPFH